MIVNRDCNPEIIFRSPDFGIEKRQSRESRLTYVGLNKFPLTVFLSPVSLSAVFDVGLHWSHSHTLTLSSLIVWLLLLLPFIWKFLARMLQDCRSGF